MRATYMDELRQLIAQNITQAREQAALNQSEAAKRLGIDRQRLIGMEKGDRPVDASMLLTLAKAYHTEVTQLISEVRVPKRTEMLFRGCLNPTFTDDEQQAIDAFKSFCQNYARLLNKTGHKLKRPHLLEGNLSATSRTRSFAVEGDAAELRKLWNIGEASPIGQDLFELLEERGLVVYLHKLESDHLAGASVYYPELGPAMMVNSRDTPHRQVFTAAHELAHVLYHLDRHGDDCFISRKLDRSAEEQLANDFASAFLMPETGIKQFLSRNSSRDEQLETEDIIALQRHFRVSYAAMLYRLKKLGILRGGAHFDALKEVQPVKEARRLGYPVQSWEFAYRSILERPKGLPEEFVSLVLRAYEHGQLGQSRAAAALEMDVERFQAYLVQLNETMKTLSLDSEFEDAAASVG